MGAAAGHGGVVALGENPAVLNGGVGQLHLGKARHDDGPRGGEDLLRRQRPHGFQTVDPGVAGKPEAQLLGGGQVVVIAESHAALQHGPGDHPLCQGACEQGLDAHAPGALAEEGDVLRIPAEGGDVLPHPGEGRDLVQDAVVAADGAAVLSLRLGGQPGMGQKAHGPQAVVDGDQDHAPSAVSRAVELLLVAEAAHKGAAVDPEGHGQPCIPAFGRGPDIQIEAVLADGGLIDGLVVKFFSVEGIGEALLHAAVGKARCGVDALPALGRHGPVPAQLPHRGLRVGDPQKQGVTLLLQSLDFSVFARDDLHAFPPCRRKMQQGGRLVRV